MICDLSSCFVSLIWVDSWLLIFFKSIVWLKIIVFDLVRCCRVDCISWLNFFGWLVWIIIIGVNWVVFNIVKKLLVICLGIIIGICVWMWICCMCLIFESCLNSLFRDLLIIMSGLLLLSMIFMDFWLVVSLVRIVFSFVGWIVVEW